MQVSRRELFRYAAVGSAALGAAALGAPGVVAAASPARGTLVDYSGGVPDAAAIRAAGHTGAIRYVSDRRPEAQWMLGKPMRADEASALAAAGLEVVSCYQFGKGPTADWRGGFDAGVEHATRGLELHRAAGGPEGRPIYASIDDKPSSADITAMIVPYIRGWESIVGAENTGVYANSGTIDRLLDAGAGAYFWQHDWGTPEGYVHPEAHLHQFEIDERAVDGVGIDLNAILKPDYGQWSLA
ncbi:DUF1906 domain-containing protein [Rhodococcus sp. NPDC003348]